MPPKDMSWTKKWKHLNWNGLAKGDIVKKKAAYRKKAVASINKQVSKLYKEALKKDPKAKKIKYTIEWAQEQVFYLNTYIIPPPNSKQATTNPPPPPQPG